MITEERKEFIINRLNQIQRNLTFNRSNTKKEKDDWSLLQTELRMSGLKIGKKHINGLCTWVIKDIKPKKERVFRCGFKMVDLSPAHNHLKGNCSTRSLCFVLNRDYDEVEAEQYRVAGEMNEENENPRYHYLRNSIGVTKRILERNGYVEIKFACHPQLDLLAFILSRYDFPMLVASRDHATVIHNENGNPYICDKWDCRGIRGIRRAYIPREWESEIREVLSPYTDKAA